MPTIRTARTIMQPITEADIKPLIDIFDKPAVKENIGAVDSGTSRFVFELMFSQEILESLNSNYKAWKIVSLDNGKTIGQAGFQNLERIETLGGAPDLVCVLDEPYWGNGLGTEVAFAVLDYGFNKLEFERIVALIKPGHAASARVAAKLGMEFVRHLFIGGHGMAEYSVMRKKAPNRQVVTILDKPSLLELPVGN